MDQQQAEQGRRDGAGDWGPDTALAGFGPRAAPFIVTIYGDVVEPRGGLLWMGTLIDICADVGVSETRVRTAVSRLVAAGQLRGERAGRRSFYRLTPVARADYARAAGLLFDPPPPPDHWRIVCRDGTASDDLAGAGYAPLGPGVFIAPDHAGAEAPAGLSFRAEVVQDAARLREFAAARWDLGAHAQAYRAFLDRFAPTDPVCLTGLGPRQALILRLALVHGYRYALLRDPRLPPDALPPDWPGFKARVLFARAYVALSPGADSCVGRCFQHATGSLPTVTPETRNRLLTLSRLLTGAGKPG